MPIFGKQNLQSVIARAPQMTGFDTDAWELKDADILNLAFEVMAEPAEFLVPPGLHPSIPPYATLTISRFPNSPIGAFQLAQVRLIVRAGIRPRGLLLGAYTDSEKALTELPRRWGFTLNRAEIVLQSRHDRVIGQVIRDGRAILDMMLENPEHISGSDVTYLDSLHLARVLEGDKETPLIVQVDPEYVFQNAQRGKAHLLSLQADAWGADNRLRCTSPMHATFCRCDTDLPKLRFGLDPSVPAVRGSRRLAA